MGGKTNGSKERGVGETVAKESGGGGRRRQRKLARRREGKVTG